MRILFKVLSFFILLNGTVLSQTDGLKLAGRWPDGPSRAVAVEGNYAYINNGSALEILDITNPGSFNSVGKLDLDDYIYCIRVTDRYAYVGGMSGLYIVDISDKAKPKKANAVSLSIVLSTFIKDNFVYAACGDLGLKIVDVSNPSEPKIVSSALYHYFTSGVSIVDSLAYACGPDSGLYVLNVKNKTAPVIVGHYDFNHNYDPIDILVNDSIAYITSGNINSYYRKGGFHALNIKNPSNIFEESRIDLVGDWSAIGAKITLNGNYAYVTSNTDVGDYVTVADISNPRSVKEVLKKSVDDAYALALKEKRLFVTTEHKGLISFDLSNPASLIEGASFKTAGSTGNVVRKGDFLYVANSMGGLKVLDISKPSAPTEVFSYKGINSYESCNTVGVQDTLLFAGFSGGGYGFSIFSLGSMQGLKKISESLPADVVKLIPAGNYAYAARPYEFMIYNAADPFHPGKIFSSTEPVKDLDIALNGSTLFLLDEMKKVKIFDVSNPSGAVLVNEIPVLNAQNFCLNGSYLYVSIYDDGIKIFDVSDPKNPKEAGKITDTGAYKIVVQGGFAYVFFTGRGLRVYNLENPASPQLVRFYEKNTYISDMFVDKDFIIFSETSNGLSIFANDVATSVVDNSSRVKYFSLMQNYPNPFNPSTTISYSITEGEVVRLKVFDMLGKEVATLQNEYKEAGTHSVQFNASQLPSGIYIYTIQAGGFRDSKKLMILK
ncbi:MAG: T9SS type A sorting domain-containing protein [Acidobacteriota bacterium]